MMKWNPELLGYPRGSFGRPIELNCATITTLLQIGGSWTRKSSRLRNGCVTGRNKASESVGRTASDNEHLAKTIINSRS